MTSRVTLEYIKHNCHSNLTFHERYMRKKTGCGNTIHLSNVTHRHLLHKEYFSLYNRIDHLLWRPPSRPRIPVHGSHRSSSHYFSNRFSKSCTAMTLESIKCFKFFISQKRLQWKEYNPTTVLEGNSSNTCVTMSIRHLSFCKVLYVLYVCVCISRERG